MSIVLVTFPGAPTPCLEAIQKEKKLDEVLEKRVTGIIQRIFVEICILDHLYSDCF